MIGETSILSTLNINQSIFFVRFPRLVVSWLTIAVMLTLAILICVICIIIYRMAMNIALASMGSDDQGTLGKSLTISITGGTINLLCVLLFNFLYGKIAEWVTEHELHRSVKV